MLFFFSKLFLLFWFLYILIQVLESVCQFLYAEGLLGVSWEMYLQRGNGDRMGNVTHKTIATEALANLRGTETGMGF